MKIHDRGRSGDRANTGPHRRAPVSCCEVEEPEPSLCRGCSSSTRKHRETEHHRDDLQYGARIGINRPLTTDREPGLHLLTRERTIENSDVASLVQPETQYDTRNSLRVYWSICSLFQESRNLLVPLRCVAQMVTPTTNADPQSNTVKSLATLIGETRKTTEGGTTARMIVTK